MKQILLIIALLFSLNVSAQMNMREAENSRIEAFQNFSSAYKNAEVTTITENDYTYYFKGKLMIGYKYEKEKQLTDEEINNLLLIYTERFNIKLKKQVTTDNIQYYSMKDRIVYSITVLSKTPDTNLSTVQILIKTVNVQ